MNGNQEWFWLIDGQSWKQLYKWNHSTEVHLRKKGNKWACLWYSSDNGPKCIIRISLPRPDSQVDDNNFCTAIYM